MSFASLPRSSTGASCDIENAERHSASRLYCCGRLTGRNCVILLVIAVVCTIGSTLVLTPIIGNAFAARGVKQAVVSFQSLDVGDIDGVSVLYPRVVGSVSSPSPFNARFFATTATINYVDDAGKSIEIGTIWLPDLYITGGQDLDFNMSVKFRVEHPYVFGNAAKKFVSADNCSWSMTASVNVEAWVFGLIQVSLSGVPFEKTVTLQSMSGFSQEKNPITMEAMTSAYGHPDALEVGVAVNIFNPSYVTAHIVQPMQFNVTQRGRHFGVATISNLHFAPGNNRIPCNFLLQQTADNIQAIEEFVLGYIRADAVEPVAMKGSVWSTQDAILAKVVNGLALRFNFKPPKTQFIEHIEATIGFSGLSATAKVYNPLPADIIFDSLKIAIREESTSGEDIFLLDTAKSDTHVPGQVLRPSQTSLLNISLSLFDAHLTDPVQLIRLISDAHDGKVLVGVVGPVTITVAPSFRLTVQYSSENITCILKCPVWCGPGGLIVV